MADTNYNLIDIDIAWSRVALRYNGDTYKGKPKFNNKKIRDLLRQSRESGIPKDYGKQLMEAAFPDVVLEKFHVAAKENPFLRIRLIIDIDAPELHSFWWESLYDRQYYTLGCSQTITLSRYLVTPALPPEPLSVDKLKMLIVIANPSDLGTGKWEKLQKLDVAHQKDIVDRALKAAGLEDYIEWHFHNEPATRQNIRTRLNEGFHILHLVGHGNFDEDRNKATLALEDDDQHMAWVDDQQLGDMIENLPDLKLAVLVVCESGRQSSDHAFVGLAGRMVERGLPAVIAMQDNIEVETARIFTRHFYAGFTKTRQNAIGLVDAAVNWARDQIRQTSNNQWDWPLPVLFLRGDGRLFSLTSAPAKPIERIPTEVVKRTATEAFKATSEIHLTAAKAIESFEPKLAAPLEPPPAVSGPPVDSTQRPAARLLKSLKDKRLKMGEFRYLCGLLNLNVNSFNQRDILANITALVSHCEENSLLDSLERAISYL